MEFLEKELQNNVTSNLVRLMHRHSGLHFKRISELGLHPGQMPVMGMLRVREGVSLREMAEVLHVKPPTVTVTVKRLEKAGMVCKKTDEQDMRVTRIYLTEKGRSMASEIEACFSENEQILTRGFSDEEIVQLRGFLRRMTENLIQAGAEEFVPPIE